MNINRKKLTTIISSFIGFALSALGTIAIFYPNAFNLETTTIKKFSSHINDEINSKNLHEFLNEHHGKIVDLNISVCSLLLADSYALDEYKSKCPILRKNSQSSDNPNDVNSLIIDTFESDDNGNIICEKPDSTFEEGIDFNFDKTQWSWNKNTQCEKIDSFGTFNISGYFLVPDNYAFEQGWIEWLLKSVDQRDVKLKDY